MLTSDVDKVLVDRLKSPLLLVIYSTSVKLFITRHNVVKLQISSAVDEADSRVLGYQEGTCFAKRLNPSYGQVRVRCLAFQSEALTLICNYSFIAFC